MKQLQMITRQIPGKGTFGTITHNQDFIVNTVEQVWSNNERYISCVPGGNYALILHHSPSKGLTLALVSHSLGVAISGPYQRTHCLFHVANFPHELQGCIGPGLDFHSEKWGVSDSAEAMKRLFSKLGIDYLNPDQELLGTIVCGLEIIRL